MHSSKHSPSNLKLGAWFFAFAAVLVLLLVGAAFMRVSSGPDAIPLWSLPAIATAFVFALYGLHAFFGRAPSAADAAHARRQSWLPALAFVAFAGSIVSVGGLYLNGVTQTIRDERFSQLTTVAALKAQIVEKWILERTADLETAAAAIARVQQDRSLSPLSAEELRMTDLLFAEWVARDAERRGAWLFSPDGAVLVSAGSAPTTEEIHAAVALAQAHPPTVTIVEADAKPGEPRWTFLLPIVDAATGRVAAILGARNDPSLHLFTQLDEPVAGLTGEEIALVRRRGDGVVMLKPPKRAPDKSGQSLSLAHVQRPIVQAVLQGDGTREGLDYNETPVLSASRHVAGVPWMIVTKSPQSTVALAAWRSATPVAAFLAGSVIVAGLMLFTLAATQRADVIALKARHLEQQAALTRHFESMVLGARDSVLLADPDGRIVEANPAAVESYGYSPEEFRKLTISDLRTEATRGALDMQWREGDSPQGYVYETVHRRKDGTAFPVEVRANAIEVNGKVYRQGYIRDITRRKELEKEVCRLSHVQEALQAATSLLLRAHSEDELYTGMCESIVNVGGYRMAIVALANDDARRTFRVATFTGPYAGTLDRPDVSWGEGEFSTGTVGTAVRTGTIQVNQNVADSPDTARWRDELLGEGVQSYIGLPLWVDGRVIGALAIYSDMPFAFDHREVDFLRRLADDIAYRVTSLRAPKVVASATA